MKPAVREAPYSKLKILNLLDGEMKHAWRLSLTIVSPRPSCRNLRSMSKETLVVTEEAPPLRARPERLSGWASRDSKEVFRPAWSERCGPQPLAGSIVARDFDTKRI